MANTYIYLPGSGNGGPGGVKFTYSVWFKLAKDSGDSGLVSTNPGGQQSWDLWVNPFVKFKCYESTSLIGQLVTKRQLRDIGAWYNIVVNIDFANVTEDQRMKLWINGVQQTGSLLSAETYPSTSGTVDSGGSVFNIGRYQASSDYFKGSMSNIHFYDGYAYDASDFGEFDSTSGIWKIKTTEPSATYGTYGFNVKMEDRTNLDLDSSSNALAFTTGGTLTATYDNPSNNFCTLNPLDNYYYNATYSNGNLKIATVSANYTWATGTQALTGGKWYFENKVIVGGSGSTENMIGIAPTTTVSATAQLGSITNSYSYYGGGGIWYNGSQQVGSMPTYTTGDIVGCAIDLDNNKIYWHKNGVYINSGDPTDSATGTAITAVASTTHGFYYPAIGDYGTPGAGTYAPNFGNGYFDTTAVSSANADDAGIGAMEYDVPAGYYCICTKNIKSQGG